MAGHEADDHGVVYDRNCRPVAHAWLDFWQADAAGAYDNAATPCAATSTPTRTGRYTLETVVPGEYPGRTVHIHVKVRARQWPDPDHAAFHARRGAQHQRRHLQSGAADERAGHGRAARAPRLTSCSIPWWPRARRPRSRPPRQPRGRRAHVHRDRLHRERRVLDGVAGRARLSPTACTSMACRSARRATRSRRPTARPT